jgi:aminoglycoside phosphotransferase (APT) family kinase protein
VPEIADFEKNFLSPEWSSIAESILETHGYSADNLRRAGGTDHIVFFFADELVLKIYRPERNCFERERTALEFAHGRTPFLTPEIIGVGEFEGLDYLIMTRIQGNEMTRPQFLSLDRKHQISIITELALGLTELHQHQPIGFVDDWSAFVEERAASFFDRQIAHGVNATIIDQLPEYIARSLPLVPRTPTVFMHADVHFGNLRFAGNDGAPVVSGLFDFADSRVGWHEYDVLAIGVLIIQGERELQREFLQVYGYSDTEMNDEMRRRLMMLTMLYETADLRRYALRLRPDAVDLDLYELEKAIWAFV